VRGRDNTASLSASQDFQRPTDITPTIADPKESTDQATHHRMAERICGHRKVQFIFVYAAPSELHELTNGGGSLSSLAERSEIVQPQ
jgi:hypothetical protein